MREEGYLFVHFIDENENSEQVYFSLSKDGLHFQDLNNGEPVLMSHIGEKGVRDPFIIRSIDGEKYFIIATDLRIASKKGWESAVSEGSKSLVVWESKDLVTWSKERMVEVGIEGAGCVWAPEAIYDKETKQYFVFWASNVKEEGEEQPKQRIYCSYTSDFKHFTKAEKYIERDNHVIDTTIIEKDGVYYRFSKDETTKNIRIDKANKLIGEPFEDIRMPQVESLFGVEGPEIFKFNDRDEWCLIVDQFATGKGYLPMVTNNLNGDFRVLDASEYDMGLSKKRHGSILSLNEEEYERLIQKYR